VLSVEDEDAESTLPPTPAMEAEHPSIGPTFRFPKSGSYPALIARAQAIIAAVTLLRRDSYGSKHGFRLVLLVGHGRTGGLGKVIDEHDPIAGFPCAQMFKRIVHF
jgi:hypothetical protein